ncbi:spore coat protein [Pelosinus propionicus]|uniref:Coat F domain-containing protein n=1 Tax=Pelosinus propionicus DSM 13327 TaxID=1123291 RepID=A0A1I4J037_9FIRM|nr:spore coat protein [Pelosinus propionicus]SFL59924.1 Coat F domain-containing protein [Pelosinus propionicus DSM 13327]
MAQAGQQNQQQNQQQQQGQMNGQGSQFADQDILQLALNESKHIAESINSYILEAANEQLRKDYMNVLGDVYSQQKQIFDVMQQKGFYNVENATAQQINKAQSKFSS